MKAHPPLSIVGLFAVGMTLLPCAATPSLVADHRGLSTSAGGFVRGVGAVDVPLSAAPASPFVAFDETLPQSLSAFGGDIDCDATASQKSSVTATLMQATGEVFAQAGANSPGVSSTSAGAHASASSTFEIRFVLDRCYDYTYTGVFSGWGGGIGSISLNLEGVGSVPLLASGAVIPGVYTLKAEAFAAVSVVNAEAASGWASYDFSLTLRECAIPDGVQTLGGFLVGTWLLRMLGRMSTRQG